MEFLYFVLLADLCSNSLPRPMDMVFLRGAYSKQDNSIYNQRLLVITKGATNFLFKENQKWPIAKTWFWIVKSPLICQYKVGKKHNRLKSHNSSTHHLLRLHRHLNPPHRLQHQSRGLPCHPGHIHLGKWAGAVAWRHFLDNHWGWWPHS